MSTEELTDAPEAAEDPNPHGHHDDGGVHQGYSDMQYVIVALVLAVITAVEVAISYIDMHSKLVPQLISAQGSYDLIVVDFYWVGEFTKAGWLMPLDDLAARDGVDTGVYVPKLMDLVGRVDGTLYMLPFYNYSMAVIYRQVPKTSGSFFSTWRLSPCAREKTTPTRMRGQATRATHDRRRGISRRHMRRWSHSRIRRM